MMSATLKRLDDDQLPAGIRGVAQEMFTTLAPEMQGFSRVALSNLWLFGPLLQKQLEASGSSNAMLRTTTALTIVQAGNKDNVLPGRAGPRSTSGCCPATPSPPSPRMWKTPPRPLHLKASSS